MARCHAPERPRPSAASQAAMCQAYWQPLFFGVKTVRFNPERVSQQSLGSTRSGAPQVLNVRSLRTLKGFHKAAIERSSCCGTPLGNAVKDFESFNPWPRGQVVQTRCGLASRPRVKRLSFSVQESLTALPVGVQSHFAVVFLGCAVFTATPGFVVKPLSGLEKTDIVWTTERPPCLLPASG